jgi:hypothetical protein
MHKTPRDTHSPHEGHDGNARPSAFATNDVALCSDALKAPLDGCLALRQDVPHSLRWGLTVTPSPTRHARPTAPPPLRLCAAARREGVFEVGYLGEGNLEDQAAAVIASVRVEHGAWGNGVAL